jgi:hypothetical protein
MREGGRDAVIRGRCRRRVKYAVHELDDDDTHDLKAVEYVESAAPTHRRGANEDFLEVG